MNDSTPTNMLEALHDRKTHVIALLQKAHDIGLLDDQRYSNMIRKIEESKLTIGVVGQMKAGKSTFLNAFVFRDIVLPAATTPMTAALSTITFGEQKKIRAEFYTSDEWSEQCALAKQDESSFDGDLAAQSKIKAAKELVSTAQFALGTSLTSLLGKSQEDSFENLKEYVGAKGKYVGITKSVTVFYPAEYLRGVEIVDTPGFNDPVVSREERTKEFLKKADVVILMLYAGEPFSAEDREILFKHVGQCGIGKVLVAINKYDIPFLGPRLPDGSFDKFKSEGVDTIRNYVKEQIQKACSEEGDDSLNEILSKAEPLPLAAEMALLSSLPMSEIERNHANAWNRYCAGFGITGQAEMLRYSRINDLEDAIRNQVLKEKEEILFSKPLNAIKALAKEQVANIERQIELSKNAIRTYSSPDEELEQKLHDIQKARRKFDRLLGNFESDLSEVFDDMVLKGKRELEDIVLAACDDMDRVIKNANRFAIGKRDRELERRKDELKRHLARESENIEIDVKKKIKNLVSEFSVDANECFDKYLPDLEFERFGISLMDIADDTINTSENENNYTWVDVIAMCLFVVPVAIGQGFNTLIGGEKDDAYEQIKKMRDNFKAEEVLEKIICNKDRIFTDVETYINHQVLDPIQQQLEDALNNKVEKEKLKEQEEKTLRNLEDQKKGIDVQIEELKTFF